MVEVTALRIGMGASVVWVLFWVVVFDRWFFFTPLGLLVALGMPLGGWTIWWKFYRGEEEKIVVDGRQVLSKGAESLLALKKRISKKRVSPR